MGGVGNTASRHSWPNCVLSRLDKWPQYPLTISQVIADVQGSSLGPQSTQLMPLNSPTGSILAFHGFTGLAKAICKSRPGYL